MGPGEVAKKMYERALERGITLQQEQEEFTHTRRVDHWPPPSWCGSWCVRSAQQTTGGVRPEMLLRVRVCVRAK